MDLKTGKEMNSGAAQKLRGVFLGGLEEARASCRGRGGVEQVTENFEHRATETFFVSACDLSSAWPVKDEARPVLRQLH
ncbi:Vacuolar Fusion Protein Ccz1-like [Manis pentadactyla]|nr:Vacuolar Fusion Protein Ccz1-like [Manis pentadactyla]